MTRALPGVAGDIKRDTLDGGHHAGTIHVNDNDTRLNDRSTVASEDPGEAVEGSPAAGGKAPRRAYSPPTVRCLGSIVELTLGIGGSNVDHGQGQPAKNGIG